MTHQAEQLPHEARQERGRAVLRLGPDNGEEARGQPRRAPEHKVLGCLLCCMAWWGRESWEGQGNAMARRSGFSPVVGSEGGPAAPPSRPAAALPGRGWRVATRASPPGGPPVLRAERNAFVPVPCLDAKITQVLHYQPACTGSRPCASSAPGRSAASSRWRPPAPPRQSPPTTAAAATH